MRDIAGGNTVLGFPSSEVKLPSQTLAVRAESQGGNPPQRKDLIFNFLELTTLPTPLVAKVVGSGTPTAARASSVADGGWVFTHEATNQVQAIGFNFNDYLPINPLARPYFAAKVKISAAAANTRFIFGLSTAYNATFDSTSEMAWFRVEGASLNLLAETDDNTTDNDDQSTGIALVAATYAFLEIDMTDTNKIVFKHNGQTVKTLAAPALTASHLMQPTLLFQKDSGTTTGSFSCKYARVSWDAAE